RAGSALRVARLGERQPAGLDAPPVDAGAALPAVQSQRVPGELDAAPLGRHATPKVAERVAGGGGAETEIGAARRARLVEAQLGRRRSPDTAERRRQLTARASS